VKNLKAAEKMLDELRTFFEDFVPREHVEEQWVKRDRSAH